MNAGQRIVVVGGTGHFGRRIGWRLAEFAGIDLIVTSRCASRAAELADELGESSAAASVSGIALDQDSPQLADRLRAIEPLLVIHTAGPYQGRDYRVARACISAGCHYVDLADGRDFVTGFAALDAQARDAGVLLVTGASTLPGLSVAVVRAQQSKFREIREVTTTIAPAQQTPRGQATVAAVLSYCGKPFRVLRQGEWRTEYGWQSLRGYRHPRLGGRLSASCDVPDLELLPRLVPTLRTVSFRAALESRWEHRALWLMAWLARRGLVRDWSRYASRFTALGRRRSRRGSDRGGMSVEIAGIDPDGLPAAIEWNLTANDNHGPEIPCTAAIVLAGKLSGGETGVRGARACTDLFTLDEFMASLSGFSVSSELRQSCTCS